MKAIREKSNNEIVYIGDDLVLDSEVGLYGNGFVANNITIAEYEFIEVDNVPVDYMGRHYTYTDGVWTATQAKIDCDTEKLVEIKTQKFSQLQIKKHTLRDAGFRVDVNGNSILFNSDINARVAYNELALQFQYNPAFTTFWKASDEAWLEMNLELYQTVIAAGKTHIENCFSWQAQKEQEINAATTVDEVNNIEI